MKNLILIALVVLSCAAITYGWGAEGHNITALIAQTYLTEAAKTGVCTYLGSCNLVDYVSWADQVRSTPQFAWSAPLHFMNTNDNPPSTCFVDYTASCPNNFCVVGAITNFTQNLLKGTYMQDSLRFLIHFIGDCHQPLHICGKELGGNDVDVTFYTTSTNLHAVWDTYIIERRTDTDGNGTYGYFSELMNNINTIYAPNITSWKSCPSNESSYACGLSWAVESDRYDCTVVWPSNWDSDPTLTDTYYNAALPVVDLRLAQAGIRMANVLNNIFTNTHLKFLENSVIRNDIV